MGRIVVGIVQMENPRRYERDYLGATAMVREAAAQGANLVLLPETLPAGYFPNQNAWRVAECCDGETIQWALALAAELKVTLGAGFVEHAGRDFYNTYFLADPSGVLGYVRKRNVEAYCYASGSTLPFIDTGLGRIGVGICADNHMTMFLREMKSHDVDMMIMPHARATPYRAVRGVKERDIAESVRQVESIPLLYNRVLGVPVVYVNPVGEIERMTGMLGKFMSPGNFRLQGQSLIAAGGEIVGRLDGREGTGVFEVLLSKGVQSDLPADHGGWLFPGNFLVRRGMIPLDIWQGRRSYLHHTRSLRQR